MATEFWRENQLGKVDHAKIEEAVKMILEAVGEDPTREGLLDTPKRVARMYEEIFSGLHQDPKEYFKTADLEDIEVLKEIIYQK